MAQRSEDGVGKTSETSKRLERAKAVWTRSAISIQASSRDDGCINRPDTRKHLNLRNQISRTPPLNPEGRPHTDVQHCGVHSRKRPFLQTMIGRHLLGGKRNGYLRALRWRKRQPTARKFSNRQIPYLAVQ